MNEKAVINNSDYHLLETVAMLTGQERFVLCEDSDGDKFVCPEDFWLRHAPKPEATAPIHAGSTSQEKIDFFLSLFRGREDVTAFREICLSFGILPAVERSRSGNGAHVWFFFSEPVSAADARKFGSGLLTQAMARRHELQFKSYDRLFPAQDTLPKGGLGNLIALPFQGRAQKGGNTLFVDEEFTPYQNQWAFLSTLHRITPEELQEYLTQLCGGGELGTLLEPEEEISGTISGRLRSIAGTAQAAREEEKDRENRPNRRRQEYPERDHRHRHHAVAV